MFNPFSKRNNQSKGKDGYVYDELPNNLKIKILHIIDSVVSSFTGVTFRGEDIFFGPAHAAICQEFGVFRLSDNARTNREDIFNYFLQEADVAKCLDIIELMFACFVRYVQADSYVIPSAQIKQTFEFSA